MSEILNELQEVKKASQEQTAASQAQTAEVAGKMGEIDKAVSDAIAELNEYRAAIEADFPFYRLTKNQDLKIGGELTVGATGTPDGFLNQSAVNHPCEIAAVAKTGVEPEDKPQIVRELFTDIIGSIPKYHSHDFAILRVSTLDSLPEGSPNNFYTIYQGSIPNNGPLTFGMWVKVESGDVRCLSYGDSDIVPNDGKWHEFTKHSSMPNSRVGYAMAPHLYVSPGASCLIAMPAVVAGKVPTGKWGFFNKPVFEREV
ncbi:TPA: hypothetical protein NKR10_004538 [Vibrio parahaemolyticus]|nr:hypothetical protein [Vibrio parahaemolyticus]